MRSNLLRALALGGLVLPYLGALAETDTPPGAAPASSQPAVKLPAELVEMEAEILTMLEITPDNRPLIKNLASVRAMIALDVWKQGDVERAVAIMANSIKIDDTNPKTLSAFADMLGDLPSAAATYLAQSYYEDALKRDPSFAACRVKLATLYQSTGSFNQAIRHFRVLAENGGGKPDAGYYRNLTLCYLATGREDEGSEFFRSLAERGSPYFGIARAILLNHGGRSGEAVSLLQGIQRTARQPEVVAYAEQLAATFIEQEQGGN